MNRLKLRLILQLVAFGLPRRVGLILNSSNDNAQAAPVYATIVYDSDV